jgi:hypothetical protein
MPMHQVKPLPKETQELDRSTLGSNEKHDLDEIVKMVSCNFSQALAEIMAAQERRRRPRD